MIIALLLALIMKRTNDNKVSQPQQTQEVVSKKEDTETNLPKVRLHLKKKKKKKKLAGHGGARL